MRGQELIHDLEVGYYHELHIAPTALKKIFSRFFATDISLLWSLTTYRYILRLCFFIKVRTEFTDNTEKFSIANCSLLIAYCLPSPSPTLVFARSSQKTRRNFRLPIAHCLLPIAFLRLRLLWCSHGVHRKHGEIFDCQLLIAYCLLLSFASAFALALDFNSAPLFQH